MQNAESLARVERERERERERHNLKNVGADYHICPMKPHAINAKANQEIKTYIKYKKIKIDMLC